MPLSSQRRIENECSWRAAEHLGIVESAFAQSAESRNRLLLAVSCQSTLTGSHTQVGYGRRFRERCKIQLTLPGLRLF